MNLFFIGENLLKIDLIDKINFCFNLDIDIKSIKSNKAITHQWGDSIVFIDTSITDLIFKRVVNSIKSSGGTPISIGDLDIGCRHINYPLIISDVSKLPFKINNRLLDNSEILVGSSIHTRSLNRNIPIISNSDSTILVTGESGVGKEVVSNAIHSLSNRKNSPFIAINCGSIPENLMESELFGYKKGSFTGAYSDHKGLFEAGNHGTVFLDEIGELPLNMQAKLLRVIQEKTITRIGESQCRDIDVRFICATNCNLIEMVKSGDFREDLFYRINVIPLTIEPLRDRASDIMPLISHFLSINNIIDINFSDDAICFLKDYKWNGNVRELINVVERISLVYNYETIGLELIKNIVIGNVVANLNTDALDDTSIDPFSDNNFDINSNEEFSLEISTTKITKNLKESVKNFETKIIKDSLESNHFNVSSTSVDLGVKRTTLLEKIKRYGIRNES